MAFSSPKRSWRLSPTQSSSRFTSRQPEVPASSSDEDIENRSKRVRTGFFGSGKLNSASSHGAIDKLKKDPDQRSSRHPSLSGNSTTPFGGKPKLGSKHQVSADHSDSDADSARQEEEKDTIPETQIKDVNDYLKDGDHDSIVQRVKTMVREKELDLTQTRMQQKAAERKLKNHQKDVDQVRKEVETIENDLRGLRTVLQSLDAEA